MYNLNAGQKKVYDAVTRLNFTEIVVDGEGGTGKSHVVSEIIRFFLSHKIGFTVAAPSHQAAASLQEKIDNACGDLDPGRIHTTVFTVQSLCAQFAFKNKYGEMEYAKPNGKHMTTLTIGEVLILEELSMVNEEQTQAIRESGAKIFALGDEAQLPPVKANKSSLWETAERLRLTEQMRNGGEIYKVAHANRTNVNIPTRSKGNVTVCRRVEDNLRTFLTHLSVTQKPEDCAYLAYRNATVDDIADLAHMYLYGSSPVNVGQYLRLNKNIKIQKMS